jgi:hypothetical protein
MVWYYNPWTVPVLIAAVIAAAVALLAWQRRATLGTVHMAGMLLGVCWWLLAHALELNAANLPAKLFALKLQYISIAILPTLWLAFCGEYAGRVRWLMRRNPLLLLEPGIGLVLAWTNDYHSLVWRVLGVDTAGGALVVHTQMGLWSGFHLLFAMGMNVFGTTLLVRTLLRRQALYHGKSLTILLGVLIATLGVLLDALGVRLLGPLQNSPFALTIAGVLVAVAMMRSHLLDIVLLA